MHIIMMMVALPRGCQLLGKACLVLVAFDKDWSCLLGYYGAGKTDPEAPRPLVFKVDMTLGKAMLRQARLNLGGMCLGSTWKMKLLPLWHEKVVARQVVLGLWELQIWANVELLANGHETLPETCGRNP